MDLRNSNGTELIKELLLHNCIEGFIKNFQQK